MNIRDMRRGHFFWLHNAILDDYGSVLGAYGIAVYTVLCRYADNNTQTAFPGVKHIANTIGCSDRQVQRMLSRLDALGLIGIRKVKTQSGDHDHNEYALQHVVGGDSQSPPGDSQSRGGDSQAHDQDSLPIGPRSENDVLWQRVLAELQQQMTHATFETWLRGSRLCELDDGHATVQVQNAYAAEWCATRLLPAISRTLCTITGCHRLDITFTDGTASFQQQQF